MLTLYDTNCCAIQEISGLHSYGGNAKSAMKDFCKATLPEPVRYKGVTAKPLTLYSFYLFTAACSSWDSNYGGEFAAYIKIHKLGNVWESTKIQNMAFHADHSNQVWIWTPNLDAIRAWWAKAKLDGGD